MVNIPARPANTRGASAPAGAWLGGDARPNGYGYNGDVRQLRREYQETLRGAEDLRRLLGEAGVSTRDLNDVIAQLRQFDSDKLFDDPKALEQLHAAALNKLKEFDFNLRKKAGADNSQLSLSGSDEVPAGFRQAIEEKTSSVPYVGRCRGSRSSTGPSILMGVKFARERPARRTGAY